MIIRKTHKIWLQIIMIDKVKKYLIYVFIMSLLQCLKYNQIFMFWKSVEHTTTLKMHLLNRNILHCYKNKGNTKETH